MHCGVSHFTVCFVLICVYTQNKSFSFIIRNRCWKSCCMLCSSVVVWYTDSWTRLVKATKNKLAMISARARVNVTEVSVHVATTAYLFVVYTLCRLELQCIYQQCLRRRMFVTHHTPSSERAGSYASWWIITVNSLTRHSFLSFHCKRGVHNSW